jgi:hypothetical protein
MIGRADERGPLDDVGVSVDGTDPGPTCVREVHCLASMDVGLVAMVICTPAPWGITFTPPGQRSTMHELAGFARANDAAGSTLRSDAFHMLERNECE